MSRTRVETVVSYSVPRWAGGRNGDKDEIIDVVLPEGTTDFMVTDYDGAETLYIVKGGKLFEHSRNGFKCCGEKKKLAEGRK